MFGMNLLFKRLFSVKKVSLFDSIGESVPL